MSYTEQQCFPRLTHLISNYYVLKKWQKCEWCSAVSSAGIITFPLNVIYVLFVDCTEALWAFLSYSTISELPLQNKLLFSSAVAQFWLMHILYLNKREFSLNNLYHWLTCVGSVNTLCFEMSLVCNPWHSHKQCKIAAGFSESSLSGVVALFPLPSVFAVC